MKAYRKAFDQGGAGSGIRQAAKLQFGEDFGATTAQNMTKLVHGMVKNAERVDKHMKAMREKHGLPE